MARGGKGGKGPKPTFTRVIPKFLQQYETMLTGPKTRTEGPDGEEIFTGGESFTDGGGAGAGGDSGMPGRGRGRIRDSNQGGGGSGGASSSGGGKGSGGSGDAFGDYDEEEVAALEAYMKTHPSKEEDKEALRKRAKELSARIGSGQDPESKKVGGTPELTVVAAGAGSAGNSSKTPTPEEPFEYTDASGRLKFKKRPVAAGAADKGESGDKGAKKKAKRAKLAKLSNTKLLSFGDDEDG